MKKNLLKSTAMFFAACAASMTLNAQNATYPQEYVVDIFDAMPRVWTPISKANSTVLNPARQANNTSTRVLKLEQLASDANITGAEVTLTLPAGQYAYAHIMMYSDTAITPSIKVNTNDAEIVAATALTPNTWTDVVYAIPASSQIDFLRVSTNVPTATKDINLYIDNVVLNNDANPTVKAIDANAAIDNFNYTAAGNNNQYALSNDWSYSTKLDNYNYSTSITFTSGSATRGMVEYNGKLYFTVRKDGTAENPHQIAVLDGKTGSLDTVINLPIGVFTYEEEVNAGTDSAKIETKKDGLANNDINKDQNGNLFISNLVTSASSPFHVWAYNIENDTFTKVLESTIAKEPGMESAKVRFDAFGVYGSYPEHLVIMAQNASNMEAYKWVVENGVVSPLELIMLDDEKGKDETDETKSTNPGTAPRIYPIDDEYFYLDGNTTFPTLYDSEGTLVDNFYVNPETASSVISKKVTFYSNDNTIDTVAFTMNEGHNGLQEFELTNSETGDKEYFLACASRNTIAPIASSYAIFKFADENKSFKDAEMLFVFPGEGLGTKSNAYRTAIVNVENVNDYTVNLYLYTGENGIAKYTMTNMDLANKVKKEEKPVAVDNATVNSNKVYVNDNVVTLDNKANVEVYTILGQKVAEMNNVNTFTLKSGMYVVVVDGVSNKVIIK